MVRREFSVELNEESRGDTDQLTQGIYTGVQDNGPKTG